MLDNLLENLKLLTHISLIQYILITYVIKTYLLLIFAILNG